MASSDPNNGTQAFVFLLQLHVQHIYNALPTMAASQTKVFHHQDSSLAISLAGIILSITLFGMTNVQTLNYYQGSGKDPMYLKLMIALVWSLGALEIGIESHYVYLLGTNPLFFFNIIWTWGIFVIASTLTDCIIRLYYTLRVWIMSERNLFLTAIATALNLVTFIASMAFAVKVLMFNNIVQIKSISWLLYTGLGSSVAGDSLIAISLCYILRKKNSKHQRTRGLVNTLTIYIVNTGILTSLWATCCFILFTIMPNSLIFAAVYASLSKLYFNALLATLNMRKKLSEDLSVTARTKPSMGVSGHGMPTPLPPLPISRHAPSGSFSSYGSSIENRALIATERVAISSE